MEIMDARKEKALALKRLNKFEEDLSAEEILLLQSLWKVQRPNPSIHKPNSKDFHFEVSSLYFEDRDEIPDPNKPSRSQFVAKTCTVILMGNNAEGNSVYLEIMGYRPYIMVTVPPLNSCFRNGKSAKQWLKDWIVELKAHDERICQEDERSFKQKWGHPSYPGIQFDLFEGKPYHGYTHDDVFDFVKIQFKTKGSCSSFIKFFEKIYPYPTAAEINKYRALPHDHPEYLKFNHIRRCEVSMPDDAKLFMDYGIAPSQWIRLEKGNYEDIKDNTVTEVYSQYAFRTRMVHFAPRDEIAKMIISSMDEECQGDIGMFPNPKNPNHKMLCLSDQLFWSDKPEVVDNHLFIHGPELIYPQFWTFASAKELLQKIKDDLIIKYPFAEDGEKQFQVDKELLGMDQIQRFNILDQTLKWIWKMLTNGSIRFSKIRDETKFPYFVASLNAAAERSFLEPAKVNVICMIVKMPLFKQLIVTAWDTTQENDCPENVFIHRFKTEKSMIKGYIYWQRMPILNPDMRWGWNLFGFDGQYLFHRIAVLGLEPDCYDWGKFAVDSNKPKSYSTFKKPGHALLVTQTLNTKAYGKNEWFVPVPPGQIWVDDMELLKKLGEKLRSFSLDNASKDLLKKKICDYDGKEKVVKEKKQDLPHYEIPDYFYGDAVDRAKLAIYCWFDTELVRRIMTEKDHPTLIWNQVRCTGVPAQSLVTEGTQIRVYVPLRKMCMSQNPPMIIDVPIWDPVIDYHIQAIDSLQSKHEPGSNSLFQDMDEDDSGQDDLPDGFASNDSAIREYKFDYEKMAPDKKQYMVHHYGKEGCKLNPLAYLAQPYCEEKDRKIRELCKARNLFSKSSKLEVKKKAKPKTKTQKDFTDEDQDDDLFSEEKMKGGYNMLPIPGMFDWMFTNDFNSLYPTDQISGALCYTNIILDPKYAFLPGVEYIDYCVGDCKFRFVKRHGTPKLRPSDSVIPENSNYWKPAVTLQLLTRFLLERKVAQQFESFFEELCYQLSSIKKTVDTFGKYPSQLLGCIGNAVKTFIKNALPENHPGFWGMTDSWLDSFGNVVGQVIQVKGVTEIQQNFLPKLLTSIGSLAVLAANNTFSDFERFAKAQKINFNKFQNELKLNANGTFGFELAGGAKLVFGNDGRIRQKGMAPCLPVGVLIPAVGQSLIKTMIYIVETGAGLTPEQIKSILVCSKNPEGKMAGPNCTGLTVIYGDTDSIMVHYPMLSNEKELWNCANEMSKYLNEYLKWDGSILKMPLEKVLIKACFFALGKNYMYISQEKEGKPYKPLTTKGLSHGKRDAAKLCKEVGEEISNILMGVSKLTNLGTGTDKEKAVRYLRNTIQDIYNGSIPKNKLIKKLIMYTKISKDIEDYTTYNKSTGKKNENPPHIKLARLMELRNKGGGPRSNSVVTNLKINPSSLWSRFENKTFWISSLKNVHKGTSAALTKENSVVITIAREGKQSQFRRIGFLKGAKLSDAKQYVSDKLFVPPDSFDLFTPKDPPQSFADTYDEHRLATELIYNQTYILRLKNNGANNLFVYVKTKNYYIDEPNYVQQWNIEIDLSFYVAHLRKKILILFSNVDDDPSALFDRTVQQSTATKKPCKGLFDDDDDDDEDQETKRPNSIDLSEMNPKRIKTQDEQEEETTVAMTELSEIKS